MFNNENPKKIHVRLGITFVFGMGIGWCMSPLSSEPSRSVQAEDTSKVWTCSMHPQIQQSESGGCPLCGMDLIPLTEGDVGVGDADIHLSERAMMLASIETTLVQSEPVVKEIDVRGRVAISEETEFAQTSHVSGRIEDLLVTHNGQTVKKGDIVAKVYSPELTTAQEELLEAAKMVSTNPSLLRAAKAKMRNWKLSDRQIERILKRGSVIEEIPIVADVSGTILRLKVTEGDHLMVGQSLYELVDLSTSWVLFDIYERDLLWVEVGDVVSFATRGNPNQIFNESIQFIDPVLNQRTRTAKARVLLDTSQTLRTGEWVEGTIVTTSDDDNEVALQIPKTAVLWTGKTSVVYVKNPSSTVGIGEVFEMREVQLGSRLKDTYIVESGLFAGEEVVMEGAFSVDSAVQLIGKQSMMREIESAIEGVPSTTSIPLSASALRGMKRILSGYIALKDALQSDDVERANREVSLLKGRLDKVSKTEFASVDQGYWEQWQQQWGAELNDLGKAHTIKELRRGFVHVSAQWISLLDRTGPLGQTLYVQYCPMADNNQGATWVSTSEEITNPYFGASMLHCGEIQETWTVR